MLNLFKDLMNEVWAEVESALFIFLVLSGSRTHTAEHCGINHKPPPAFAAACHTPFKGNRQRIADSDILSRL